MAAGYDPHAPATAARVRQAGDALRLDPQAYRRALELARPPPGPTAWIGGVDRFLLAFGVMAVLAGVAAFFAYNWDGLHRLAKLGFVELGIAAGVAVAAWRGIDSAAGRGGLFAAAFLVGVLFAVYGQSYQTGADPYSLFLFWAILIAGWVAIGRQAGLWMLLLVLANLSLILYWTQVLRPDSFAGIGGMLGPILGLVGAVTDGGLATLVVVLNVAALVLWESFAGRGIAWMRGRWWPRVVTVLALAELVTGTIFYIFGARFGDRDAWLVVSGPILFFAFAVASLWFYRRVRLDLFVLTATLVGVIVCVTTLVARSLSRTGDVGVLLVLAILVVVQTAGAAYWLRRVAERESGR